MASHHKLQSLGKSSLTSRTQTPETRSTSETHWVRDWHQPSKPPPKQSSQFGGTPAPTELYPFQIKAWTRSENLIPLNKDSLVDDVFDLSQFRYGNVPEAITEQPGTTTGLSEADIRGAVGGSNTLFSSSTDAQEEVPKPVNVASTEADSPQVNVAEAMDVDKPTPVVEGDVDVVPIVLDAAPSDTLDVTPSPVDDVSVPLVSTEGSVPASDAAMNTPADVEML